MELPTSPLFKLGKLLITPGALEGLQASGDSPWVFLRGTWLAIGAKLTRRTSD